MLRTALNRYPSVELRGGVVVADRRGCRGPGPVRVRYRAADPGTGAGTGPVREVWADYVLGADGANSRTRAAVGASMEDLCFEQQWLIVDVASPEPLRVYDGVQQVCATPTGPPPSCRSCPAATGGSSGCAPASDPRTSTTPRSSSWSGRGCPGWMCTS